MNNMDALIFDIQNASYVDGPGVRTVIFFKGCNMRCQWCHNPEGLSRNPQLMVYKSKCTRCGGCGRICQNDPCALCGRCADICPAEARKLCGVRLSLDDVFTKVKRQQPFFESSGGGVTCSGGECMMQPDFLCELLALCRQEGIHTAVDTAGNVPWPDFQKVLPVTDLFLYDIKCVSPALHKAYTGADNALVLDNYKRLREIAKVRVRIPIIKGFNTDARELENIAAFLREYPPEDVEPLMYHSLGRHKYEALGLVAADFEPTPAELMKKELFIN